MSQRIDVSPNTKSLRSSTRRAFTVVELVIVLVIAGVVLALGLPKLNLTSYRADAGMQAVRAILLQAQRTSLQRQIDVLVLFDTTHNKVTVVEDANDNGAIDAGEHVHDQLLPEVVRFVVPPTGIDSAVHYSLVATSFHRVDSLPAVTFHRDGSVSANLDIYLVSGSGKQATYRAIRMFRATARTDWYKYNGTVWVRENM